MKHDTSQLLYYNMYYLQTYKLVILLSFLE